MQTTVNRTKSRDQLTVRAHQAIEKTIAGLVTIIGMTAPIWIGVGVSPPRHAPPDQTVALETTGPAEVDSGDIHVVEPLPGPGGAFSHLDYPLPWAPAKVRDTVVTSVPRLFLASLPDRLPAIESVNTRKEVFIRTMLPLVLRANEMVLSQRRHLVVLAERIGEGDALDEDDLAWLDRLALDYNVKATDPAVAVRHLLNRVDAVPPSLALAQAAIESGWGTSRFAQQGNALFGQWTFEPGTGIVPAGREEGATHEIKTFPHLLDAVRAYLRNLNTHRAYRELRDRRARMRAEGVPLDALALADTLTRYSERGQAYVDSLKSVIRYNRLRVLDRLRLAKNEPDEMAERGPQT